jgi:release factor glutamine methyltransferase
MKVPLATFIAEQAARLQSVGIEAGRAEVELILCYLLENDRLHLYLNGSEQIRPEILDRFETIVKRRMQREPLQFILTEAYFFGRTFYVTPDVMAPTPETELLCEAAITFAAENRLGQARILDIGVGSGVISVTLVNEISGARVVSLDLSPGAITVAKKNAVSLGGADRIEFRQSDLFASVKPEERFDLIVSNPPYIAEPDYAGLPPEVLADPKMSLVAGADGLDVIRVILQRAPEFLAEGGRLMFEIGYDQSEKIAELTAQDNRYMSLTILKDLNNIDRIVILGCDH